MESGMDSDPDSGTGAKKRGGSGISAAHRIFVHGTGRPLLVAAYLLWASVELACHAALARLAHKWCAAALLVLVSTA